MTKKEHVMRRLRLLVTLLLVFTPKAVAANCSSSSSSCNTTSCGTSCCAEPLVRNAPSCGNSCCPVAVVKNDPSCCQSICSEKNSECCMNAGKTFFTIRPLYQSVSPELISEFRNDRMHATENGIGGAWDFVIFGGKSTKDSAVGSYFMPFCQERLTVSEQLQNLDSPGTQVDILSDHFNIFTLDGNFSSEFSFSGNQSAVGLGLHYKQGFGFNCDKTKWWYLDFNMPVMHVKNRMNICEIVTSSGGGVNTAIDPQAVANMTQAFNQSDWKYGKIRNNCPMKKTGLADIELKLGRQFIWNDSYWAAGYFGMLIPTGNVPRGEFIFEPIIGNGKHMGLIWGGEAVIEICTGKHDNWHLALTGDAHAQYLWTKTQIRSFDLKNRPWSRYMEVYADLAQAQQAAQMCQASNIQGETLGTPGINVFTQPLKVRPGLSVNTTTALRLRTNCGYSGEIGYNFYARQQECVKLACLWARGPALKSAQGCGTTNPVRNISNNANINDSNIDNDLAHYSNSEISAEDLDLESAAAPAIFAHIVYGTVGYIWNNMCTPVDVSVGGSYEFGDNLGTLHRWVVWGKAGIAF